MGIFGHCQPDGFGESGGDVDGFDQGFADDASLEVAGPGDHERYPDERIVETAALEDQAVVAEHFAVIAGEDDDGVVAEVVCLQEIEKPAELLVDQFDHGVVGGFDAGKLPVLGGHRLRLEVDASCGEFVLVGDIGFGEDGLRQGVRVEAAVELPGGVVRGVGVEGVEADEPGLSGLFGLADEVDGHFGAPGGLVVLRRGVVEIGRGLVEAALVHVFGRAGELFIVEALQDHVGVAALAGDPLVVVGVVGVVATGGVAVLEETVAVIGTGLGSFGRTGEVELAGEAAVVAGFGEDAGDETLVGAVGEASVAVTVGAQEAGVHAGKETGTAGGADGALHEGVGEDGGFLHELVDARSVDVGVAEPADGVEPLLVGAVPDDVGRFGGHVRVPSGGLECS